ncbi:vacuolar protein sorting-associated protein 33A isoform X1 [Diaphorina citri]|jgi:Proteins involved in synaptic transmission and general secretion, Sec1 family|uniref:Vacuolar protein sorting-associated protein 33A isoform X1 n=1 Tax=Diaphorina citri TaxID=121845 RepID=A0A1S3CX39_DIACI|nr:vacuolar protein sorting-associated protein 33A isoform X1 [Diaphorina citri]KAI5707103.1 hypothetical protein M8J75_014489 [Diaphorina citri]KAI5741670.1 hypothetical protein M8J76_015913 [Diaphorina citri]KAI5746690.1 hypothetical protein M8J77_006365 [Diaphorina citri]
MSTHLSGGKVNISLVQDFARTQFLELLEKCSGKKAIIWDDALAGPVGLVANVQLLNERDVKRNIHLKPGSLPPMENIANVIFITRPIVKHMDIIADNIKRKEKEKRSDTRRIDYHLFFVPRKSLLCEQRLQENGVLGNFNIIEAFTCNLFPFDNDLVSMEMELAYREYHLEKDPTCLYEVAQAIITLQNLYGIIPRVSGKGPCVQQVWDLTKRLSLEPKNKNVNQCKTSQISQLILIDRNVDVLTPLATQLTYEGLIDEIFGIHNTTAKFPGAKFSQSEEDSNFEKIVSDKKSIILNSGDELFAALRDKIFTGVGPYLSKRAKFISAQFDTQNYHEKSVSEMKTLVQQLPHMINTKKLLANHTNIAELIKDVTDTAEFLDALHAEQEIFLGVDTDKALPYIENAIAHKKPLMKVLKLICMQSFTSSGLKPKVLEYYKREIIQTYGFQHILTLSNLEQAGLLKNSQNSGTRQYTLLRKMMRLTVEDSSELAPADINFVHSIYAPLSIRLVQRLTREPSIIPQDLLALLPGAVLEETQTTTSSRRNSTTSTTENTNVVVVFFIGGCTYAEISALRFLSQQEENNIEYIVATTKLINGDSFIKSLMEPL